MAKKFISFRTGLWMHDIFNWVHCVVDGYEKEYSLVFMSGWQESEFNDEIGFSADWDKVSVEKALKALRRDKNWTKELEEKFLDFPEGFVDPLGKPKFDKSLGAVESIMQALRERADFAGKTLPEDAEILDFKKEDECVYKAYCFARDKHRGQKDKAGKDYILHPMKVASVLRNNDSAMITALLHDVVEDTEITFKDLEQQDFVDEEIMETLGYLTHDESLDYAAYIDRISEHGLARFVKIADLMHNADLRRIETPTEKDCKRARKYIRCIWRLLCGSGMALDEFRDMLKEEDQ